MSFACLRDPAYLVAAGTRYLSVCLYVAFSKPASGASFFRHFFAMGARNRGMLLVVLSTDLMKLDWYTRHRLIQIAASQLDVPDRKFLYRALGEKYAPDQLVFGSRTGIVVLDNRIPIKLKDKPRTSCRAVRVRVRWRQTLITDYFVAVRI